VADKKISELTLATPADTDVIPFTDVAGGVTYKALKSALKGDKGADGLDITWLGAYSAGTTYAINDAVSYNGSSYICTAPSTGNLPTDTGYWDLMAQKGSDGAGAGDVIGPATNTDSYIPQWNGANSKTLKDGIALTSLVKKSLFGANTILAANSDNTPAAVTIAEQKIVGRATGGNITALDIDSDLSSVSANDDTVPSAKATKAALDAKLALAGGTMTGDIDLGESNIIYDAVMSADNKGAGDIVDDIVAGETIAFPQLVYLKSDGKWWKADADAIASTLLLGLSLESKNADEAVKVLLRGFVRDDDWNWTVGGRIYASVTEGSLSQTAPTGEDDVVAIAGYATHADRMYFCPDNARIEYKA